MQLQMLLLLQVPNLSMLLASSLPCACAQRSVMHSCITGCNVLLHRSLALHALLFWPQLTVPRLISMLPTCAGESQLH